MKKVVVNEKVVREKIELLSTKMSVNIGLHLRDQVDILTEMVKIRLNQIAKKPVNMEALVRENSKKVSLLEQELVKLENAVDDLSSSLGDEDIFGILGHAEECKKEVLESQAKIQILYANSLAVLILADYFEY